jgi:hypothetical protein
MSALIEKLTAAAQKEFRFDPLTEARENIYQPSQPGLMFPGRPAFDDVARERQYLKERLVGACRAFARQGFDYGFAGHLTIASLDPPCRACCHTRSAAIITPLPVLVLTPLVLVGR